MKRNYSLASRTLRLAILRIGLVSIFAGAISYFLNQYSIEHAIRQQLLLSTEQTIQRESLPFLEIRELQRNFLDEFKSIDADPHSRGALVKDFDQIFYRHADGSYTQRPGLFEGKVLPDGRRFAGMSATYAPDIAPDDDVKARFTLSYMLSHKYGSTAKGRLFNFYGVVPEKGFPIYQAADIAKVFTYTGPDALKLDTYEFYSRGFNSPSHDTFFTRMYWDYSNNAWMTTVATPDIADASGKHRILACVDVLLDELMQRIAHPAIQGAHSTLFLDDGEGTLIYHPDFMDAIKKSEGHASIKSLKIENDYPLLTASTTIVHGKVVLIDTKDAIIAVGHIPETPAVLAIHYPKALMQPAILQNLAIVITLGFLTLLVEIFIIRSILQNQVATPLSRLIRATRLLGASRERLDTRDLPTQSQDEIGELARDFSHMAKRVQDVHEQLESKVYERTVALEAANQQLTALSVTDKLTGIANRRRYDEVLANEWQRAQRTGGYLMLAMLDVDWFKKYNDHYGHQAGDDCLRSVAQTIAAHANRAGDLVARYGGEEFALVITTISPENALTFAQRLCEALEKVNLPHAMSPFGHVTVSIGVACATYAEYESAEDLLRKADEALYAAKEQGRNQAMLYVRPAN
ncbi:MAG: diguanylate cyclase [Candidatus Methylopumilus sp.]